MSVQLTLLATDAAERFEQFHADNPRVYDTLLRLAREWIAKTGQHKVGINSLFEVARWQIALATTGDPYKLNNDYRAFYARLIMAENPDLTGLFDLRTSEADDWIQGRTA